MKTHKRLKTTIKTAFSFSDTEIEAAFRRYSETKDIYSSEAVNAFGGFLQLVKAARYAHKRKLRRRLEARKNLSLEISQDSDAENPRDWDNMGTMVCFHGRYSLGDDHELSVEKAKELYERDDIIALPLYLYDHSGLTMSTTSFSCPWDSEQVGLIYISKEKLLSVYSAKRLTKKLRQKALDILRAEVKTYDQYLNGDVYGYVVKDGDGEILDSCYGFFGHETAEEAGKEALEALKR